MTHITFIGAGNMANSIIGGLIQQNYPAQSITASDPNRDALAALEKRFGIHTNSDNSTACEQADVVVLAVKPQILKAVTQSLSHTMSQQKNTEQKLLVSIAAGISIDSLSQWLGNPDAPIIRCMPNTPALVSEGASGLYANISVSDTQKQLADQLMSAVGSTTWLDSEALLDSVTAVSGSGPAYFFLLMEAMIEAGIKQGLSREQAQTLTLQTAKGAAILAQQSSTDTSNTDVAELRQRVTSPGGTTEQAILSFEASNFRAHVDKAMLACADRAREMSKELS